MIADNIRLYQKCLSDLTGDYFAITDEVRNK